MTVFGVRRVGGDSDYRRNRDDAAALALLQVGGVEPQIRPFAGERPIEKGRHPLVDLPRFREGRLLHSLETCHLLIPDSPIACTRSSTRRVDTPADPGLLDHRDQRLLRALAGFEKRREVAASRFREGRLCRSFGIRSCSAPRRVSRVRSR